MGRSYSQLKWATNPVASIHKFQNLYRVSTATQAQEFNPEFTHQRPTKVCYKVPVRKRISSIGSFNGL